jgi:glycosyltransferase involved in cell wall biosynthesis
MPGPTGRPRLLFLCHTLPYPPDAGVWIRTYHVLRLLAQAFDITALCFERAATAGTGMAWNVAAGGDGLGRFAEVEVFAIPQQHNRLRWAWDHLRSAALGRVYTVYLYRSRAFHRRVNELLRSGSFDLVHVDSLDLSDYVSACRGVPIVCVHHDISSVLLRRRASVERSRWRRAYLQYQAALMEREERCWCNRIALNVTVSEREAGFLEHVAPGSRVAIVPNGVDVDEFRPSDAEGTGVAFAGGATGFPNRDALDFFCDEILPQLRAATSRLRVRWIGRASVEQQCRYRERYGVELTGYVEDVRPLMRDAACHIVPLRVGGGTRLKILNSWAMGKAVVSTSIGCEGLATADGGNILIRDDPKDFASAILAVLRDDDLRRALGERGRATVERLYSWDVVGQPMIDTYLTLATGDRGRRYAGSPDARR